MVVKLGQVLLRLGSLPRRSASMPRYTQKPCQLCVWRGGGCENVLCLSIWTAVYTCHGSYTPDIYFHLKKRVPTMTAAIFERYAIFLAGSLPGFEYGIECKNTKEHYSADGLSRLSGNVLCNSV